MLNDSQRLEAYLDRIGELEGAPLQVIDQAKRYGRTLLFHANLDRRKKLSEAKERAASWLRRRTNRTV